MPSLQARKVGYIETDSNRESITTYSFRYSISLPKKIVEELKWMGGDDITAIKTDRGIELVRTQDLR